jgi:hypothetical protein
LAMLDTGTGEVVNRTLRHEGNSVREFYSALPGPVRVGIEITASAFFYCLGIHFFSVVAREVYDQLPKSRWSWFASHSLLLHREYYPDSWLRTKFYFCGIGMLACGLLAFFFWMK